MGPIVLLVAIIGASVIGRELPAARARPLRETAARGRVVLSASGPPASWHAAVTGPAHPA